MRGIRVRGFGVRCVEGIWGIVLRGVRGKGVGCLG